jgi:PAS domain S-box-containing protein
MDFTDRFTLFARTAAGAAMASGGLAFLGWVVGMPAHWNTAPAAAVAFLLAGAALLLRLRTSSRAPEETAAELRQRRLGVGIAGSVALLGALSLAEHAFQLNLRIDNLWRPVAPAGTAAALTFRMAPDLTLGIALIGAALLLIDARTQRGIRPSEWLALAAVLIGFLALLARLFHVQEASGLGSSSSSMPPLSAATLVFASASILTARPNQGIMAIVTSNSAGGVMARRLLPACMLIPPLLGWLRGVGQDAGWYDAELGRALVVWSAIVVFTTLIWKSAGTLDRIDSQRAAEERAAQEGQILLQAIADNSPAVIFAKNLAGQYLLVNRRFHELMKTDSDGVRGKTDFDLFPHEVAAAFRGADERAVTRGAPITEEEVLPHEEGLRYFVSVKCPLRDGTGRPYGVFGIATEITERKRAETERVVLLESERRAREEAEELFGVARTLAAERDLKKVVQHVTDAATRLISAKFGAFLQNISDGRGEELVLFTLTGAPREAFPDSDAPLSTAQFESMFRGVSAVRIADAVKGLGEGKGAPHFGMPTKALPVRSYLAVPVVSRSGAVLGGLVFGHPDAAMFDVRAERIALGIAAQAAVAIDNAKLYQSLAAGSVRLEGQLGQLRLLAEITQAIDERRNLSSIFEAVMRTLEDQLPIDFGCLCLHDSENGLLTVQHVGAKSQALSIELNMPVGTRIAMSENGLMRVAWGHLVHEANITASPVQFSQRLARAGLKALVMVPLVVESKVIGALIVSRRNARSFTSVECDFLRQLCDHVALAAQHVELYTSLQRAYDDLRKSQSTMLQQERLRALGQMSSGIAHDINNAITPVTVYLDSLLDHEPTLSSRARDYLLTIQRAIGDIAQTVARMRASYCSREQGVELAPTNLGSIITQAVEMTRPRWSDIPQENGVVIRLETALADALPMIMASENEIRDSLTNLIFNAVDAMPDGGTMSIRVRATSDRAPNAVDGTHSSERVIVEIEDTGIGMDEATRDHCLEPFFSTKGERGTGLGLAMVYGMVQRHGATAWRGP